MNILSLIRIEIFFFHTQLLLFKIIIIFDEMLLPTIYLD